MSTTQTTNKSKWDNEELGVAWRRKTAKGDAYWTGVIKVDGKDIQFVGFSNKTKKADNHPDIRLYISKPQNKSAATPKVKQASPEPVVQEENNVLL